MASFKHTPFQFGSTALSAYLAYWAREDPNPLSAPQPYSAVEATIPTKGNQFIRSQPKPVDWLLTINLPNIDQTTIDGAYDDFSPDDGLQYLLDDDGDGKRWRTQVVCSAPPKMVNAVQYKVPLHCPIPVWEENTAPAPQVNNNQTTAPFTQAFTVLGNRLTDDIQITISPDTAKSLGYDDWKYSLPGFYANRAPKDLVDEPVYLFDQSGAAARLATGTSATGATVLQTTGLTSITVDISALATTITLASGAGWPAKGMGFLTDSRGNGFHDQFAYSSIAGAVLSGVTWLPAAASGREPGGTVITAGGIAHTQAQETGIQPSGTQLSADDLAVWLDGRRIDDKLVYPVAWNGAASDVIAVVTMPRRQAKTIAAAMTAGSPANGGFVQFLEGVADIAEQGIFVVDNEVFAYTSRDVANKRVTVRRAMHGSTAAVHAVGATADFSVKTYVVAVGKATAPVTPRPLASRPAIQLPGSSNLVQKWGDEANDANTAFFSRTMPGRPKSWQPGFDLDGNDIAPLMQISASGTILTFKDDVPGDGGEAYNFAEMPIPQGIDAGSTAAINMDWTPAAEILNLELFGRDGAGRLKLLDQLQQAAVASNRVLPAALAANNYGIKLKARYNVFTGARATATDDVAVRTVQNATAPGIPPYIDDDVAIKFTLTRAARIIKFMFRGDLTGAGTQTLAVYITKENAAGDPSAAAIDRVSNNLTIGPITNTSPAWLSCNLPRGTLVQAGTYWFVLHKTLVGGGNPNVDVWGSAAFSNQYTDVLGYDGGSSTWGTHHTSIPHALLCIEYDNDGEAAIQSEDQPVVIMSTGARHGGTASFDGVEVTLEPTQTVYVHRFSAFASALYHYAEAIDRVIPLSGSGVTIDRWGVIPSNVVIDCKGRTAIYTENGYAQPFGPILDSSGNFPQFLTGLCVLNFAVPDIVSTDYSTAHRGRKA